MEDRRPLEKVSTERLTACLEGLKLLPSPELFAGACWMASDDCGCANGAAYLNVAHKRGITSTFADEVRRLRIEDMFPSGRKGLLLGGGFDELALLNDNFKDGSNSLQAKEDRYTFVQNQVLNELHLREAGL